MSEKEPISYRDAGVDIDAAEGAISRAKALIESTHGPECLSGVGSFGGLFRPAWGEFEDPVLVSSTDSVGTKVKVAVLADRHDTVGGDIVNHCVNDILVQGARPLFFLDYIGIGKVEAGVMAGLLTGLARACSENGCALLGGETAEMPDVYSEGEYDLVGTVVGIVDRERILTGSRVEEGDVLIGLPSTGLHTNGYTLVRRIVFEREGLSPGDRFPGLDESVADVLLAVHRSYLAELEPLLAEDRVHALAHITGGGLLDNIPRVLPSGLGARIDRSSWEVPSLFRSLAEMGPIREEECFRAFNMGIGMVVIALPEHAPAVLDAVEGAVEIGRTTGGAGEVELA